MTKHCRLLAARYRKWAGLERQEPTWGWIWSITLHAVVALGVVVWIVFALWVFPRLIG